MILFLYIIFHRVSNYQQSQYKIPSYYGSWERNFFLYKNITEGSITKIFFRKNIDYDRAQNTYYIADKQHHVIKKVVNNKITVFAGVYDQPGFKNGYIKTAKFNNPSSIIFVRLNRFKKAKAQARTQVVTKNNECLLNQSDCIIPQSQQSLKVKYKLQNIRFKEQITQIQQDFDPLYENQYLIVSDNQNHCIRKINLSNYQTTTIAGICQQKGFYDGPIRFNKFNKPSNLGMDDQGILFVYDSGNDYIRMIQQERVHTLLKGSCNVYPKPYGEQIYIGKHYLIREAICYKNWKKNFGQPKQHIYDNIDQTQCLKQYSQCTPI